jgi:hypothetical protein
MVLFCIFDKFLREYIFGKVREKSYLPEKLFRNERETW